MTPNDSPAALAEEHRALAFGIARQYRPTRALPRSEIRSAAMLGLCRAAAAAVATDGRVRSFGPFAAASIRAAIVDAFRESKPLGYRRSPDAPPRVISVPNVPEPGS